MAKTGFFPKIRDSFKQNTGYKNFLLSILITGLSPGLCKGAYAATIKTKRKIAA